MSKGDKNKAKKTANAGCNKGKLTGVPPVTPPKISANPDDDDDDEANKKPAAKKPVSVIKTTTTLDPAAADSNDESKEDVMPTNPYDCVLDVSTPSGLKLFERATKGSTPAYVGGSSASALRNATGNWRQHIKDCRLDRVMMIKTRDPTGKPVMMSLLNTPRMITFAQVIDMTKQQLGKKLTQADSRQQLDSNMLFQFLWKSIAGVLKTHVQVKFQDGTIGSNGPALYKLIIEHFQGVATNATICNTQESLRNVTLKSYNNDIRKMHHAVHELNLTLKANNAVPDDMHHILLMAYNKGTNTKFQRYANTLADELDANPAAMSTEMLMSKIKQKFNTLVADGDWATTQPSPEASSTTEATIVALTAALTASQNKNKRFSNKRKNHSNSKDDDDDSPCKKKSC